jgi:hypothetical protein
MLEENFQKGYSNGINHGKNILYETKDCLLNSPHANRYLKIGSGLAPAVAALAAAYVQSHLTSDLPDFLIIGSVGALFGEMTYGLFLQLIGKEELESGWFEL